MKKFITALSILFMFCYNAYSQSEVVLTGIENYSEGDSVHSVLFDKLDTYTVETYMQLNGEQLLFDDNTKKRPDSVKQVQIYIVPQYRSTITTFNIVLKEGANAASATSIGVQNIITSDLKDGWNNIDLATPIYINPSQNLYVGCSVRFRGEYLPIGFLEGTNEKQAWLVYNGEAINLVTRANRILLIKAVASLGDALDNEISLIPWDNYRVMGDSVKMKIKNIGKNPITFFDLKYTVNGATSEIKTISNINVASGDTFSFVFEGLPVLREARRYNMNVKVSQPNGETDLDINNERSSFIYSLTSISKRMVLHEAFSSSTCVPCNPGNQVLKKVLDEAEKGSYVSVKYQCNFPGVGDPYYTSEIYTKISYYGINTVPTLIVDGPNNFRENSRFYRKDILERLSSVPAFAKITGEADVNVIEKRVEFNTEIEPHISFGSDVRFFAVIVEKWTENNVKSNGETRFFNVVKKFLTPLTGTRISSVITDTVIKLNYNYTFNGEYRLPEDARDPIILTEEHSVEDFQRLKVVYWIQDYSTKEVYQAGEFDPFPSINNISEIKTINANMSIFPNPLYGSMLTVELDLERKTSGQIAIYDMLGKEVLRLPRAQYLEGKQIISVNTSGLSKGIYFIRLNTPEGSTARKLIIAK